MEYLDTIKLGFGHSLIIGNVPEKVSMDIVSNKLAESTRDVSKLGFFDSNSADYNTYYPEVSADDLVPKDNEFIEPVFRALSEVIVHKEYNPVDFSRNGVLKKSSNLLVGATINADHEMAIGNAMGAVKETHWQDSYKTAGGIIIPAGINARLKIDGKSHPRVARAINMDPPAIHSTSVTVQYLWEKSHAELSQEEFYNKLGSFDKDGKLICRIATNIKRYHEISLVSHGADPFAQLIKDTNGQITNPVWGDISYNSITGKMKQKQNYFFFDNQTDIIKNSIPPEINNKDEHHKKDNIMNKTFLIALAAIFGVQLKNANENEEALQEDIDAVQLAASTAINTNTTLASEALAATAEITRLKKVEEEYTAKQADFLKSGELASFKESATKALRESVKATYTKLGENLPAITGLIETASFETLSALGIQYTKQLEDKYPMSCNDCKSHNVSRATVKLTDKPEGEKEDGDDGLSLSDKKKKRGKSKNKSVKVAQ